MPRSLYPAFVLPLFLVATVATAQRAERWRDDCERGWNDGRARLCELRTYTVPASTKISVDGGANGGVTFIGENPPGVKNVGRGPTRGPDEWAAKGGGAPIFA